MKGAKHLRVCISGRGQMGQKVLELLPAHGHEFVGFLDTRKPESKELLQANRCDVVIDFSTPSSAAELITTTLHAGVPIVSGTTGWLDQWEEVLGVVTATKGTFFYASNFNLGVNLFFELNEKFARLMEPYGYRVENPTAEPLYRTTIEEWHHTRKKDAPSGTAITLAEGLIKNQPGITQWKLQENMYESVAPSVLPIKSFREGNIVGTHRVTYAGTGDDLHIEHRAHDRSGFARGAIMAAEFIIGKQGHYSMSDLLNTPT